MEKNIVISRALESAILNTFVELDNRLTEKLLMGVKVGDISKCTFTADGKLHTEDLDGGNTRTAFKGELLKDVSNLIDGMSYLVSSVLPDGVDVSEVVTVVDIRKGIVEVQIKSE